MKNIIDDLYLGNINPNENMRINEPEYLKLLKESVALEKELTNRLSSDDKKLFEDFINKDGNMNALEIRLRFIEGFKIGVQIMLEALKNKIYDENE